MASPYTQRIEEIKAAILPLITEVVAAAIEEARQEPNKEEKQETADRYLQKRYIVSDGKGGFTTIIQPEPSPMLEYEVIVNGTDFWEKSDGITSPKADAEKIANRILRSIPRYTFTDYIDLETTGNLKPLPRSSKTAATLPPSPGMSPANSLGGKGTNKSGCCVVVIAVLGFLCILSATGKQQANTPSTESENPPHQATAAQVN